MTLAKSRTLRVALEALVGLVLGLLILASVGIYVLSRGPISVSALTPMIEQALNTEESPYHVTLEDTRIVWGGWDRAVDVIASNVTIKAPGAPPLAVLQKVSVGLSFKALLSGDVRLRVLEVLSPKITLLRNPDGTLAITVDTLDAEQDDPPIDDKPWIRVPHADDEGILPRNVIDALTAGISDGSALSSLELFRVVNAEVRIIDRSLGETLWLHSTYLDIARSDDGLIAQLAGALAARGNQTPVRASINVIPEDGLIDLRTSVTGLDTDLPIRYFPELAFYLPDMTVSGTIGAAFDLAGNLDQIDLELASAAGAINLVSEIHGDLPAMTVFASFESFDTAQWLAGLYEAGPALAYLPRVPITGTATVTLDSTATPIEVKADIASDIGGIVVNAMRNQVSQAFSGTVDLSDIKPDLIADSATALAQLSAIQTPISGKIEFVLDQDWMPVSGRVDATFGAGGVSVPGIAETLPDLSKGELAARMESQTGPFVLETANLSFGDISTALSGSVELDDKDATVTVNGLVLDMPMNQLSRFWPEALASDARSWVTGNIPEADVHQAGLAAVLKLPDLDTDKLEIISLSGGISFDEAEVHYLRPLTPVTGVSGFASYSASEFDIDIFSGALEDARIQTGRIEIDGLDISDETIDIKIALETPLPTAMTLLDTEPRRYIQKIGLDATGITGSATANVYFQFPLLNDLKDEQIIYGADAVFTDITVPRADINAIVTAETAKFDLVPGQMTIVGDMQVDGTPAQIVWTENFAEAATQTRSLSVNTVADISETQRFGIDLTNHAVGRAGMKLTYLSFASGAQSLGLSANLRDAVLTADQVGWRKESGVASDLSMQLAIQPDGRLSFESFVIDGGDDHYLEASVEALPGFADLTFARFDAVRFGRTDITASIDNIDGLYTIDLQGPTLDVASFLHDEDAEEDAPDPDAPPVTEPRLRIHGEVGQLIDGTERQVQEAIFALNLNGEEIDLLTLQGIVGDGRNVDVNYTPTVNGGHQLFVLAEDTGMALAAADLTGRLEGGTLLIDGLSTDADAPMNGNITIRDFQIKEAPALARLLEVISVTGILSALSNEGLPFNSMTADFSAKDDVIKITNGAARSSSIGISFQGKLDRATDTIDLNGDIAVSDIFSRTIGQLPLIDLLVGDGLIGATYSMTGPTGDPDVSVNPLSVIAPGFLRKVFGEGDPDAPKQPPPPPPNPDDNNRGN